MHIYWVEIRSETMVDKVSELTIQQIFKTYLTFRASVNGCLLSSFWHLMIIVYFFLLYDICSDQPVCHSEM